MLVVPITTENVSGYGFENNPPNKPNLYGPNGNLTIKTPYTFYCITTDPDGDQVSYKFFWGDGTYSEWLGPYPSNEMVSTVHEWANHGSFSIMVKAKDHPYEAESEWSDPITYILPKPKVDLQQSSQSIELILAGMVMNQNTVYQQQTSQSIELLLTGTAMSQSTGYN